MDFDLTPAKELFSKSKLVMSDQIQLGEKAVSTTEIIAKLEPLLLPERIQKIKSVVQHRRPGVVTVLENIYDRGNISAVMRTAEALGFYRFSIVEEARPKFKAANRVTKGAEKWLDVQVSAEAQKAIAPLKAQGFFIVGTDLEATHSFDELEFSRPTAIVIGNEKEGVTEAMRAQMDARVKLPMVGFSQSFNLSVAAALVFQRVFQKTQYTSMAQPTPKQFEQIYANYLLRCIENPNRYF